MEVESDVDTGEEGFVECFDSVGGEEEDAAIVLGVTETIIINEEKKRIRKKNIVGPFTEILTRRLP